MNNAALQDMWTAILALLRIPDYRHREFRQYIYNYQLVIPVYYLR
ncbi:hypothetical protein SAMN05518672_104359 [Chitinophaga sp. CF118]|nr:hypothetical protein SAMN05518672_104359 [Chitinophaga sp. CF118]